ncbi:hypothetical protein ACI48D_03920 [Massilia sp. LXY-6]|uniref:hypothetical protein n=1 Tax=Massilia sp. LXY-6 TaxID=3379823 RepID=UPI003EE23FE5
MHTQQEQSCNPFSANAAIDRSCQAAAEYVSAFPTALALARWTRGGDIPHLASSALHAPIRAAWYAQAQCHFQAWLEDGGFYRQES